MAENEEYSEGGSKIERYEDKEIKFRFPDTEDSSLEEIDKHLEKYIGKVETVFHEIISDTIHIDIHLVPPTSDRNFYTLITSGMSDKPMNSPFEELRYAELIVCLPNHWKISEKEFEDENYYWVIRWLKILARFPHQVNSWLWETHTIPNGKNPQPYAQNTKLCCALIASPMLFDKDFRKLKIREDKTIHFLSLIPIYKEEMDFKLKNGIDELYKKFDKSDVTELLNINRKNTCQKLFGLF